MIIITVEFLIECIGFDTLSPPCRRSCVRAPAQGTRRVRTRRELLELTVTVTELSHFRPNPRIQNFNPFEYYRIPVTQLITQQPVKTSMQTLVDSIALAFAKSNFLVKGWAPQSLEVFFFLSSSFFFDMRHNSNPTSPQLPKSTSRTGSKAPKYLHIELVFCSVLPHCGVLPSVAASDSL